MHKMSAYRVVLIRAASASLLSSMMFTIMAVYYVQEIGMNPLQLVLVGTVVEATTFVFEIPTGILADVYSRRLSIIIGELLMGLCFVIQGLVPVYGAVLAAEFIRGVGWTFVSGAEEAWLADEVGGEQFGCVYARMRQVGRVGGLVGMGLGVALATVRLSLPVFLGGLGSMLLAGFLALAMSETNFVRRGPAAASRVGDDTPCRERYNPWRPMRQSLMDGLGLVHRRPVLWMLILVSLVLGIQSEGFDRLWEAHLLAGFRFPMPGTLEPVVWFGIIGIISTVLGILTSEGGIRYIDMTDSRTALRALKGSTIVSALCTIGFGLTGHFWPALVAFWGRSVAGTVFDPVYTAWLNRHIDSDVRATVFSISGQANSLGQVAGGPVIGLLGMMVSLRASMLASGMLLLPAMALFRHHEGHEPAPLVADTEPLD
ncbi:MAG: MFS transporter [Anaerolineae bacterium]|jgi:DHA3 family tetracycline resistance protein-like MFS transporter